VRDDGAGAREKGGACRGEKEPIYLQCKESEIQNHCFQNWQPPEEEQHATTSFTSAGILTHSYNQHTVTHSCIETQPHSHTTTFSHNHILTRTSNLHVACRDSPVLLFLRLKHFQKRSESVKAINMHTHKLYCDPINPRSTSLPVSYSVYTTTTHGNRRETYSSILISANQRVENRPTLGTTLL